MPRKILRKVPEEQLKQDLGKYRQRAIELGASDAKVITTEIPCGLRLGLVLIY